MRVVNLKSRQRGVEAGRAQSCIRYVGRGGVRASTGAS